MWCDCTAVANWAPIKLIKRASLLHPDLRSVVHLWAGCACVGGCVGSEWSLSLPARGVPWCPGELWAEPELLAAAIRLPPCPPPPGIHLPPAGEGQILRYWEELHCCLISHVHCICWWVRGGDFIWCISRKDHTSLQSFFKYRQGSHARRKN